MHPYTFALSLLSFPLLSLPTPLLSHPAGSTFPLPPCCSPACNPPLTSGQHCHMWSAVHLYMGRPHCGQDANLSHTHNLASIKHLAASPATQVWGKVWGAGGAAVRQTTANTTCPPMHGRDTTPCRHSCAAILNCRLGSRLCSHFAAATVSPHSLYVAANGSDVLTRAGSLDYAHAGGACQRGKATGKCDLKG